MYYIIGADHAQYGPVTGEEVRQWIRDGRADGQTLGKAEGETDWKPLASFAEFADLTSSSGGTSFAATGMPAIEEITARDYEIDISDCVKRSWAVVQQNFWPVVGTTFLTMVAMSIVNQAIGLISKASTEDMIDHRQITQTGVELFLVTYVLSLPIQTLFSGGLFRYYLKLMRGEEATVGDAFSGFSLALMPLALLGLVMGLLVLAGSLACLLPGMYLSIAWIFAIPLVIDRKMDFWPAMMLSMKLVNKHWFSIFLLVVVAGLLSLAGVVACCVGVFVTAPIGYMALLHAYEDIFNRRAG